MALWQGEILAHVLELFKSMPVSRFHGELSISFDKAIGTQIHVEPTSWGAARLRVEIANNGLSIALGSYYFCEFDRTDEMWLDDRTLWVARLIRSAMNGHMVVDIQLSGTEFTKIVVRFGEDGREFHTDTRELKKLWGTRDGALRIAYMSWFSPGAAATTTVPPYPITASFPDGERFRFSTSEQVAEFFLEFDSDRHRICLLTDPVGKPVKLVSRASAVRIIYNASS